MRCQLLPLRRKTPTDWTSQHFSGARQAKESCGKPTDEIENDQNGHQQAYGRDSGTFMRPPAFRQRHKAPPLSLNPLLHLF